MKLQVSALGEIQWGKACLEPVRVGQGIGDRDPHVRNSHLGNNGSVNKFNQGMDDTLRMDQDLDIFDCNIKEPFRLDNFKALVHQCCRVDRYLFSHIPVRMIEGLRRGHFPEFSFRTGAKGAP